MPFEPPCFGPEFFFDTEVLSVVRGAMDDRVVAGQWGGEVPDHQRPLSAESPDPLHWGTPNVTDTPRALATIRYVRRWYAGNSRDGDFRLNDIENPGLVPTQ